ncbi:MAG: hypothetical protein ACKVQS_09655 [Fimbriimonadaceae bacterium]
MRERVVTVFGAGNMRTGPLVMAALARWYPDFPFTIRLFDVNSERLDLIDMLLRGFLDNWNSEIHAESTADAGEALEGMTDLILTMHEDCARRMGGTASSKALIYFEEADEMEFYMGGDRNKPTPVAQLSQQTRKLLESPRSGATREEVLRDSVVPLVEGLSEEVRILSLMRGIDIRGKSEIAQENWPESVSEDQLTLVPHQILRWVRGDESAFDLGEIADQSPVLAWLKAGEADRLGR